MSTERCGSPHPEGELTDEEIEATGAEVRKALGISDEASAVLRANGAFHRAMALGEPTGPHMEALTSAFADYVEADRRPEWRCFHCDFETSDRAEAAAHFGDPDEYEPLCRTWEQAVAEDRSLQLYQDAVGEWMALESEFFEVRGELESLSYQVVAVGIQIADRFPGCATLYDVWCRYESMKGRVLAAESLLTDLDEATVFFPTEGYPHPRVEGPGEDFGIAVIDRVTLGHLIRLAIEYRHARPPPSAADREKEGADA